MAHYRMDSFQLFLIKTLVSVSNRGVVGMLCTVLYNGHAPPMPYAHSRVCERSNNTNSHEYKYDARTNFYTQIHMRMKCIFLCDCKCVCVCCSLADFLSTKNAEQKNVPFVLIKECGVKNTCIFIFLSNTFFSKLLSFSTTLSLSLSLSVLLCTQI